MIRYRKMNCSTRSAAKTFKHVTCLGKLSRIIAKRFISRRTSGGFDYTVNHECVMVYGENGTARFEGLCWGYGGEGPRGTHELLKLCGVSEEVARQAAFNMKRHDAPGVDWEITFDGLTTLAIARQAA